MTRAYEPDAMKILKPTEALVKVPTSVEPGFEFVVTATLIVADVQRSMAFYRDVLGADASETPRRAEPFLESTRQRHSSAVRPLALARCNVHYGTQRP
jgi:hypothetical protein